MSKHLVIVESPTKAKTIKRYLGHDYVIMASKGHVKDLPKEELGVDVDGGFLPHYVTIHGKGTVLKEIRKQSQEADVVFLAPDPDREGEAIAWHLAEEIRRPKNGPGKIMRVLVNEFTQRGVQEAFANPRTLNSDLFNSQQARRILDRLVGYQLSPLLWDKVRRGLSAGRVQSVAVRLVVDREREIEGFKPVEFWRLELLLEGSTPPPFWARLFKHKGKELKIPNAQEAQHHMEALAKESYRVAQVEQKERHRQPPPPFITSRLQQDASRWLKMPPKRTMMIAQRLYEGLELGGRGQTGLITYMRTDSTRVSEEAIRAARQHIREHFGADRLPAKPRHYTASKKAQDAHEAIRPTDVELTPDAVKPFLAPEQHGLYALIWRRFVASQMSSAVYDATTIDVQAGPYLLRASGTVLRSPGFLELYKNGTDEDQTEGNGESDGPLPLLRVDDPLRKLDQRSEQRFTQPPPRFTEATLIRELEERGIGRPSTYASIISTVLDKEYVHKQTGRLHPTELGRTVTDLLVESFPRVLNVEFTAEMETELDKIEEGQLDWVELLNSFYGPFSQTLERARKEMRDLKRETIPTDLLCPECGAAMVIRWGKNGSFLACSGYPKCRTTREFERVDGKIVVVQPKMETNGTCPKCGSPMVIKTGRFGRFRACTNYPQCTQTAPVTTGVRCPTCQEGELVEKRTRRGKKFWGCNRYPTCKFASWNEPLDRPCPQCAYPMLFVKVGRDGTSKLVCSQCSYQGSLDQENG
ncbi:MAG: type I DNA topoisomerase [Bradymonadales bacterium]|nr:type I DNA topoisomerase [Bradymonadales bacterium]